MKRLLPAALVAAFFTASLAGNAVAASDATLVHGTVVAKDRAHRALVTALPGGTVRSFVAPAAFARVSVGSKVVIRSRWAATGPVVALAVKTHGRSQRTLVRGTVIRVRRGAAVVSAGGNALSLRLVPATRSRALAARSSGPAAGDTVTADVLIGASGTLDATRLVVTASSTTPSVKEGEIEVTGTLKSLSPPTVTTGTGVTVFCLVPEGGSVKGVVANDVVEMKCDLVGGQWLLRSIVPEDRGHRAGDPTGSAGVPHEAEAKGLVSSLSPLTVGSLACAVPAGFDLTGVVANKTVAELKCRSVGGVLTAVKLKVQHAEDDQGDDDQADDDEDEDADDDGDHGGDHGGGGDDD